MGWSFGIRMWELVVVRMYAAELFMKCAMNATIPLCVGLSFGKKKVYKI